MDIFFLLFLISPALFVMLTAFTVSAVWYLLGRCRTFHHRCNTLQQQLAHTLDLMVETQKRLGDITWDTALGLENLQKADQELHAGLFTVANRPIRIKLIYPPSTPENPEGEGQGEERASPPAWFKSEDIQKLLDDL